MTDEVRTAGSEVTDLTDTTGDRREREAGRSAVQRWRRGRKRFDYSPSPSALRVIEHYLAEGLDRCAVGVIDALVIAGHRAISGNQKVGRQ